MIHYVLQIVTFQLFALLVYDFFLKRETFFQWNRAYLLITSLLPFGIPFVKLESFKSVVPQEYIVLLPEVVLGNPTVNKVSNTSSEGIAIWQFIFLLGILISLIIFIFKIYKIYKLKSSNQRVIRNEYIEIIITNSTSVFSFFKNIFLGDKVLEKEHEHIIKHELIHVKQYHSLDLLLFELLKIGMWFNPLIYVYQKRISELHEFIADSKIAKGNKREHYQKLLSEVFKTEKISFINQFFNSSLIKKRIVMLQKSKSKNIWQFKYLLVVPLIICMLVYSSCERENQELIIEDSSQGIDVNIEKKIERLQKRINDSELTQIEKEKAYLELLKLRESLGIKVTELEEYFKSIEGYDNKENAILTSLSSIEALPVFPGCENAQDNKDCFYEMLREHVRKNFKYPKKAKEQGIQGKVYIQFVVDKEGNVIEVKKRGPDVLLENEGQRIIKKLPKMIPAKVDGKAVEVPIFIPITFKLR